MFGINVNGEVFELDKVNSDEKDKANIEAVCTNFWDISQVWNRGNILKIIQRFIQLVFTVGLLFLMYSKQLTDGSGSDYFT